VESSENLKTFWRSLWLPSSDLKVKTNKKPALLPVSWGFLFGLFFSPEDGDDMFF
jgi:hypothetical protein